MGLRIYSSTLALGDLHLSCFKKSLDNLPIDKICGIVFCGVSDEMEYHQLLGEIKSVVYEALGHRVPVTLIPAAARFSASVANYFKDALQMEKV